MDGYFPCLPLPGDSSLYYLLVTETAFNRPTGDGQAPEMAKLAGDEMASADAHSLAITHPPLMAFSGSETRTRHCLSTPSHGLTGPNQKQIQTAINLCLVIMPWAPCLRMLPRPCAFGCAPAESPAAAGSYLGNPLSKSAVGLCSTTAREMRESSLFVRLKKMGGQPCRSAIGRLEWRYR